MAQSLLSRIGTELSTIFLFLLPTILVIIFLKNWPNTLMPFAYWLLVALLIYAGYIRYKKSTITQTRYFKPVLYGLSLGCFIAGGFLVGSAPDILAEIYLTVTAAVLLFALGLYKWLKYVL